MQPQFAHSNHATRYVIGLGAVWLAVIGLCASGESVRANGPELAPAIWLAPIMLAQNEAPQSAADEFGSGLSDSSTPEIYLSVWQIALVITLFLLWVKTATWVNVDTQMINLKYAKWNAILFFPFIGAMLLHLFVLPFFVGFSIAALVYVTTFLAYTIVRNRSVPNHLKVFTGSWWRYWFADTAGKLGMKVATEKKASYEKGAPVDLAAKGGGSEQKDTANLILSRQSPGYILVKELIVDMATKRSDKVLLDYGGEGVSQRYEIDGVWHNGEARDRSTGDVLLAVMKTLSNLDLNERSKPQRGFFEASYEKQRFTASVASQGTQTGERVMLELNTDKRAFESVDQLGMREKMQERWMELVGADQGLLLLSTLPGGGLTTLVNTVVEDTDRLMRDWVSLEPANAPEHEIQNCDVITWDPKANETLASILPGVIRKYPNVYVVRNIDSPEAAKLLFDEVRDDHLVITSIPAKEAPEALLRMLQRKVPQKDFASSVTAVLYMRLIRKLCEKCRAAYEPTADVLQKLGIPQGRVQVLYRTPTPEEQDKPCPVCHGIGFVGRTGIFELLELNDEVRQLIAKQPKADLLKKAARRAGMRSLQEEGILLVAKGVTSLPELMRVLKL